MAKKEQRRLEDELDDFAVQTVEQKSEIQGAAEVLFEDKEDASTKLSSVDMRTRLNDSQIPCIAVADELSKLGVIPAANSFTRNVKRLNISLNGEGRKELVSIGSGVVQAERGGGMIDGLKRLFMPKSPGI